MLAPAETVSKAAKNGMGRALLSFRAFRTGAMRVPRSYTGNRSKSNLEFLERMKEVLLVTHLFMKHRTGKKSELHAIRD